MRRAIKLGALVTVTLLAFLLWSRALVWVTGFGGDFEIAVFLFVTLTAICYAAHKAIQAIEEKLNA